MAFSLHANYLGSLLNISMSLPGSDTWMQSGIIVSGSGCSFNIKSYERGKEEWEGEKKMKKKEKLNF